MSFDDEVNISAYVPDMGFLASPIPDISAAVIKDFTGIQREAANAGWRLPEKLQGSHATRQQEWLASRLCLSEAFAKLGVTAEPAKLRFLNHQELEGMPEYRFSFSHTRDRAACWLVHDPERRFRIGLDIEQPTRTISEAVNERIKMTGTFDGESPLARWCLREAIFKSLNEDQQSRFLKSEVQILNPNQFRLTNDSENGHFYLDQKPDYLAAFAWTTLVSRRSVY